MKKWCYINTTCFLFIEINFHLTKIWTFPYQRGITSEIRLNSDIFDCLKFLYFRYYFNRNVGACEKFSFGGCGGNDNNFKSEDECNQKCGHHKLIPTNKLQTGASVLPLNLSQFKQVVRKRH